MYVVKFSIEECFFRTVTSMFIALYRKLRGAPRTLLRPVDQGRPHAYHAARGPRPAERETVRGDNPKSPPAVDRSSSLQKFRRSALRNFREICFVSFFDTWGCLSSLRQKKTDRKSPTSPCSPFHDCHRSAANHYNSRTPRSISSNVQD